MSLQAFTWAATLPLSRCDGTPFRVLLLLADQADPLGRHAFPSVATMAATLECSERTVQRALRQLEAARLIRKGDKRSIRHVRLNYQPTVYDLLTPALLASESTVKPHLTASQG